MSVRNFARLVIYRVHEKGLEIFLVNRPKENEWHIPHGYALTLQGIDGKEREVIHLEPVNSQTGEALPALAVEGDFHDIPSIRALIKQDIRLVKDKVKEYIPDLDNGAYFAVKEAFKKVLPHEYEMLKELKEIIIEKNSTRYM